ncbi:hypothetical protein IMX07_07925 [bacterium]|nr:hypothetical protein [bacterium]
MTISWNFIGIGLLVVAVGYRFRRQIQEYKDVVSALATVVMVSLTWMLTQVSYQQSLILQKQLNIARSPLISAGNKEGNFGNLISSHDPKGKGGIVLYFHNSGQGPALDFNVQLFNRNGPTLENHMARLADDAGIPVTQGRGIVIPPDSDHREIYDDWIPNQEIKAARTGDKPILISGFFEYCDELGNYSCERFFGKYEGDPIDAFVLLDVFRCTYAYPQIKPFLPRRLHFITPCEQPSERKKEEDLERENFVRSSPNPIAAWTPRPESKPSSTK